MTNRLRDELKLEVGATCVILDEMSGLEHNAIIVMLPNDTDGEWDQTAQVLYYDLARSQPRMVNVEVHVQDEPQGREVTFIRRCEWRAPS